MKTMNYYCARLLVICLVDDSRKHKKNICDYPFIVFRAKDNADAFRRALGFGKEQETAYKNGKGQRVRWALVRVEEIKRLGRHLDGKEVGSLLDVHVSKRSVPFAERFNPKKHAPIFD